MIEYYVSDYRGTIVRMSVIKIVDDDLSMLATSDDRTFTEVIKVDEIGERGTAWFLEDLLIH